MIDSGKQFDAKGDAKAAVIQYKSAIQAAPTLPDPRWLLGRALLSAGDPQGAVLEFKRARELGYDTSQVVPALAAALVQTGDFKEVVRTLADTRLNDPTAQAELLAHVATAWVALGDATKAEALVSEALALSPEEPTSKLFSARLLADKGRYAEALAVVGQVLDRHSQRADAWSLRGELSSAAGNAADAEAAFAKALAIDKTDVRSHAALIGLRIAAGDIAGVKKQAEQLRTAAPAHPVSALVDGEIALIDNDLTLARERAQKLLSVFPDHVPTLVLSGIVESRLGRNVRAEAHFGKALAANPTLYRARIGLADLQVRNGQSTKALETLKPLLAGPKPPADALALAGQAESRQGNDQAADRYFLQAAKQSPDNTRVQVVALTRRLGVGDGAAAVGALEALARKAPDTYAEYALFSAHMRQRDYGAALKVLEAIERKEPKSADAWYLRGRVALAQRDIAAARAAFERALAVDNGMFSALVGLVSIDVSERRPDAAVKRLESALAVHPDNLLAIMTLADVKAKNGAPPAEVRRLLTEAVKVAPSAAEPRLKLIEFSLQKRQTKEALASASEAIAAVPGDVAVLEAAGRAQFQAGDVEQALSTFRRLAATVPNAAKPYLLLAGVYRQQGNFAAAETAAAKAQELEPDAVETQSTLVEVLLEAKRKDKALDVARRWQQMRPTSPAGYAMEAVVHHRLKDPQAVTAIVRQGVSKTGSSDLATRLYSHLLLNSEDVEAARFAERWLQQHPKDAAFEYVVSLNDIARGNLKLAEARLRRVVAAYPRNALALNNLGWVLTQTRGKDAVEFSRRAVDLIPDNPLFIDTLGQALAAGQQWKAAIDVQRQAVELAPEDHGFRFALAKMALESGDKALARENLEVLAKQGEKFAGHAEVRKLLNGL